MKHKLEEQMQQLADTASLKELMPEFDKEGLWQDVTTQLQEKKDKGRKIALGWLSHAAAVVVAILATYTVIHFSRSTQSPQTTAHAPSVAPISSETIQPAPALPVPAAAPQPAASNRQQTNLAIQTSAPHIATPVKQPTSQLIPAIIPDPAPMAPATRDIIPQPVTVATTMPKKVVHYLDLDADTQPAPAAEPVPPPSFVQMKLNKPDIPNSHQKTVLGTLALALAAR